MDNPGDSDVTDAVPTNHRRAGKARFGRAAYEHEPPRLGAEFNQNYRLVVASILGPVALMTGGVSLVVFDDYSTAQRIGGAVLAFVGLLVLSSYLLRFTTVLSGDGWAKSRIPRAARLVLKYSWHTYVTLLGLAVAYFLVDWLIHR